jgi:LacI family transcriptional regulator
MGLRSDPRISPRTRELVQMVARRLNYHPRASARALAGGRTHTVGIVFSQPKSPDAALISVYANALDRIAEMLIQRDYHLSLVARHKVVAEGGAEHLPRMFAEVGVDGLIVVQHPGRELAESIRALGVPYVLLDATDALGTFSVAVDECRAAELAVAHLVELGHRTIANLSVFEDVRAVPPLVSHRLSQFPRGYVRGMVAAGLPPLAGWDEPNSVVGHLEALWQRPDPPTALLTYDDSDARDAIGWFARRGLSVPRDVSIVALQDSVDASLSIIPLVPSITCKEDMNAELGEAAVNALLHLIDDPDDPPQSMLLPPRLVVRESTGVCGSGDARVALNRDRAR